MLIWFSVMAVLWCRNEPYNVIQSIQAWVSKHTVMNFKLYAAVRNNTWQVGIPIPNPRIPGSRTIFSIPNPGIGDALIPGFRDYEKRTKCPNFTWYLPEKNNFLPNFGGQFLVLKLRVSGLDPNTKYVIKVDIVLRAGLFCASLRYFTALV